MSPSSSSSSNEVSFNEGLLTQIFLCLPAESLVKCKCVSKQWHSIITSPHFTSLRGTLFNPARGLFLNCTWVNHFYQFVPFSLENPIPAPFETLCFVDDPFGIRILHSCNGLLLCCSFRAAEQEKSYYIYNPTTTQFITLPKPVGGESGSKASLEMKLAFDPCRSPHYKVVCIRMSEMAHARQVQIYSSVTLNWRVSYQPYLDHHDIAFGLGGVYWNGGIFWPCGGKSLHFNIEEEKFEKFPPMPCIGQNWDDKVSRVAYFGESCGYLHLVVVHRKLTVYDVYEMNSNGIEWFLKYKVNVGDVVAAFPTQWSRNLLKSTWDFFEVAVLCVVQGEDAFAVLEIPGMVIRYNLRDNTFYKLREFGISTVGEFGDEGWGCGVPVCLRFNSWRAFQYIESECCP